MVAARNPGDATKKLPVRESFGAPVEMNLMSLPKSLTSLRLEGWMSWPEPAGATASPGLLLTLMGISGLRRVT